MFPGYRNMDPYTQHMHHPWEHIPSPYHYYPNWEPTPIHMKTDSFNHPSACGPCPYNNQVNMIAVAIVVTLLITAASDLHTSITSIHLKCMVPILRTQNAYPPLFIPPHFDHARCDYDIDKNHCCGCPNHNSHRKEGSNVKIEEQNTSPTIDEGPATTPKGNHGSLIQFPYNYYPMMWHPENSTRDGKTEMKTESLPMLNFKDNLKDLRQGQGESTHQGDNKVLQLPYPIFWLPGNGKPEQPVKDKKEIDATPKVAEDWPSKLKIVPLKLLGNENVVEKPGVLEEETKTQHSEKESKIKTIPVMHLDSSSGEKLSMADRPEDVLKNYVTEEKKYDAEIKKGGFTSKPERYSKVRSKRTCDKLDQLYGQATNEHEEGTQKKDETSSSTSDASEITLTSEEKDLPSAGSHMKEKILSEQPSQYLNVENEFLQESEGSSMACQHDSAVSDKISDAVLEDAVKEPVGQSHIIPLKVLNDEMVPFGEQCYRIPQHEDENDSQADNLSLAEENASIAEKYVNQDVVALPPESEVLDFVMKQQPDSDQSTKWKEMRALTEQDLNDVECDSKHENPSISLLEEQIRNEEFMAVKPNEADKQSLFEVVALKEKSESKKEANSDEGAAIKPEDVTVIRNDEAPEEKSNVVGDAFVVSEELKATFKHEIASIDSESNSKDSSQETHSCTKHEKSLLGDFVNSEIISEEKKLVEDNEKLRQMLEKLLNAGQEQMGVIAELNERVKNLEKKLSKRKKVKVNQKKLNKFSHVVVGKGKVMSYEKEASSAA
ncbi:hypothetical protein IEQ34_002796 [Dendrobium chrysotoxum]|uniref:Uncharacterized protein n=1 Tax=Dendrobium chrysotoxum TaxID=161865 RepID=A0AAV7HJZ3_DENCH|nr:hypothetical protein IEQ34_002796 [Dendrobium chrysotoxum]